MLIVQMAKENPTRGFVLSIKSECLNKIIPLSESHLRRAIRSYVAHYHNERPHQGLDNDLIEKGDAIGNPNGRIKRKFLVSLILGIQAAVDN